MRTLNDAFVAACGRAADLPFLAESALSGGRVWTYDAAEQEVHRLAEIYRSRGWGAGHRVALGVGNHPRHFFHFLALNRLGASIVPLNPDHRAGEIRYALSHSSADLVVSGADRHPLIDEVMAANAALGRVPRMLVDTLASSLPDAPAGRNVPADSLRAEAAILYTSGTSGRPKGCVLSNDYVLGAGAWYANIGGLLSFQRGQDRLLNPLPVFHMNCAMVSFSAVCQTDNCLVLPDRFHAGTWWEDCVRSRVTVIHYLGIMPPALFKQPVNAWETQHRIRFALGAGCDPTLHGPFEQRFGFPLVEVWGMTETGRFLANNVDPRQVQTRAFGREREPIEVRLVDDSGVDVAEGQPGELLVRNSGPDHRQGFFSAYLDDPEADAKAWRGGWFHTGDVVTCDASGMLYFVDRRKDMVRRSGENISASEVEAALAVHPAVNRIAVLPVPDELRDEEVMAVVVPATGTPPSAETAQALVRHCLAELAYYKAPGWVVFRDVLPTTPTNKIQKNLIFGPGSDPLLGAYDCRSMKSRTARH